jgi:hypothetical protein
LVSKKARIERQMQAVGRDVAAARKVGSWSAVMAGHRQLESLGGSLDGAKVEMLMPALAAAVDPASLTAEERAARNAADAAACDDADLEVYVAEWCRRLRLRIEVVDGEPRLVPDGLRLVGG